MLGGSYEGKAFPGNTEWITRTAKISREDYRRVAAEFDPKGYDPTGLVDFAKNCGFRYLIITAKHYDGYALFDSKADDFDSVDLSPSKRDLLKELSDACRSAGMPLGFSYSVHRDWYHPGGDTVGPVWDPTQTDSHETYLEKIVLPQMKELMTGYGPVFAFLPDSSDGIVPRLASALQNVLPASTVTARPFVGEGDYRYTDGVPQGRTIARLDWEKCRTMSDSWGYRKVGARWKSSGEVLRELVQTASRGGNYLLNVGLDGEGRVPKQAVEGLEEIGRWLSAYGESIYGTSASPFFEHPWNGGATLGRKGGDQFLYLHLFGKEARKDLALPGLLSKPLDVEWMGTGRRFAINGFPGNWHVDLGGSSFHEEVTVLRVKLAEEARTGDGPVVAGDDGRFQLDVARGSYPNRGMKLERTPASAQLQLTGFATPEESGEWEIYSEAPSEVSLSLVAESAPGEQQLAISVNGGEAVPVSTGPSSDSRAVFKSSAIRIPSGLCRVRIAGAPVESGAGPASAKPLSTSLIELIPIH